MRTCVFVRDTRYPCGGFESWVEELAGNLPAFGIRTLTLLVSSEAEPITAAPWLADTRIVRVTAADEPAEQAKAILGALEALAAEGKSGVFFTGGYAYIDLAGINLRHSPWLRIPVMHGRHPSAFDWTCVGPPRKVIAPARDLAAIIRGEMRSRIGYLRSVGKVRFIPHGVPIPLPRAPRTTIDPPAAAPLRIAVVSRLDPDVKRPLEYVRIAQALQEAGVDFRMTIVGEGPARSVMERLVDESGLGPLVCFAGALPRTSVYEILGASDVLVQTSESEAFGLAVAEALACECAVVAADVGGEVARMVNKATGVSVPVGDIGGFVAALKWLHQHPEERSAMGKAGRELAQAQYSSERMLRAYSVVLKKLGGSISAKPGWKCQSVLFVTPAEAVGAGLKRKLKSRLASLFGKVIPGAQS